MDILEEAGPDIARRCYWNFGKWSDLWRIWRPLGADRPSREASVGLPVRTTNFPSIAIAPKCVVLSAFAMRRWHVEVYFQLVKASHHLLVP